MDINGIELEKYESASEAGRQGYSKFCICFCCKGKTKTHKGFKWKYAT